MSLTADEAEVQRIHMPVAGVAVVPLGVPIVEAATFVDVKPRCYHDHGLGLTVLRHAVRVIVAVSHPRIDEEPIRSPPLDHYRERVCNGSAIRRAGSAPSFDRQIVPLRRLVVNPGHDAGRARAERILCLGICDPAWPQCRDLPELPVTPLHLVKRTIVVGIQRPGHTMRRHAGGFRLRQNVTRSQAFLRPCGACP